jgi:hypothetical protein
MSELIRVFNTLRYAPICTESTISNGFYIKCIIKISTRITLLGDLNYRLNLSYETTHELISIHDWDGLFKMDQVI